MRKEDRERTIEFTDNKGEMRTMNRWKDWYEQGKRDMERAKLDVEYRYYEWACFTSQQSAEKVIKALALKLGFNVWGHSLTEMLKVLTTRIEISDDVRGNARLLDMFYIPPRYPNGFPAGKPADYFTEKAGKGGNRCGR